MRRACLLRRKSVPRISESDCSSSVDDLPSRAEQSWMTPDTTGGAAANGGTNKKGPASILAQEDAFLSAWPTAGSNDWKGTAQLGQRRGQLDEAAEQKFPCGPPNLQTEPDGEEFSSTDPNLHPQWGTPTTQDANGRPYTYPSGNHSVPFPTLVGQSAGWPRPRKRLNPLFVEWLMGWCENWTQVGTELIVSERAETVSSLSVQRMRSLFLQMLSNWRSSHRTV